MSTINHVTNTTDHKAIELVEYDANPVRSMIHQANNILSSDDKVDMNHA